MASFSRGIDYVANEEINPSKLHQLMESTTIFNVGTSDLATNMYMPNIESSRPSDAVTGGVHMTDSHLFFKYSPAVTIGDLQWLTSGHDFVGVNSSGTFILPGMFLRQCFTNWSGETATLEGLHVHRHHQQSTTFAERWGPYCVGVALATAGVGELVTYRTKGPVIALVQVTPAATSPAGRVLTKSGTAGFDGVCTTYSPGGIPPGAFQIIRENRGIILEHLPALNNTSMTAMCFLWGR